MNWPVETSLLVRTDFTDDAAWRRLCAAATADPADEDFEPADLEFVEDRTFEGATPEQLTQHVINSGEANQGYLFVGDTRAQFEGEHPILALNTEVGDPDFPAETGRTFRVVAGALSSIEANLSIGNMDFSEFADDADQRGGVFRGFEDGD